MLKIDQRNKKKSTRNGNQIGYKCRKHIEELKNMMKDKVDFAIFDDEIDKIKNLIRLIGIIRKRYRGTDCLNWTKFKLKRT